MNPNLSITFFNTADKSSEALPSIESLVSTMANKKGFYWLDLMDSNPKNFTQTLKALGIEYAWLDYFRRPEILPHMKDNPSILSFYLFDVFGSESLLDSGKAIIQIEHAPIFVLIGENFVITYHQQQLDLLEYVKKDCGENFEIAGKTPAFIVFLMIQHAMYHFARLNLANDNFLDKIEYSVLTQSQSDYRSSISIAGMNILTLKKLNANLHIILLVMVTKSNRVIGVDARQSFEQLLQNTESIRASIDSSRDLLDSIIANILSQSTLKTGEVMRVLTIISAVFMPMSAIAGIYGMNFKGMPELSWEYGYFMALGLMTISTFGFLGAFYYLGWLGNKGYRKQKKV
ncbi:MAG: magnesium transporter CorA family protein [Gammaproteobacteria bacterium]